MVKTIMCIRRRSDLTRETFLQYWTQHHAALIRELKEDLRIVRYVQLLSCDNEISAALRQSRNGPPMFDGVGTAWFQSMEDLRALGRNERSLHAMARLIKDEMEFINLAESPFWVAEELEVF